MGHLRRALLKLLWGLVVLSNQQDLLKLVAWSKECQMTFNVSKCKFMHFVLVHQFFEIMILLTLTASNSTTDAPRPNVAIEHQKVTACQSDATIWVLLWWTEMSQIMLINVAFCLSTATLLFPAFGSCSNQFCLSGKYSNISVYKLFLKTVCGIYCTCIKLLLLSVLNLRHI